MSVEIPNPNPRPKSSKHVNQREQQKLSPRVSVLDQKLLLFLILRYYHVVYHRVSQRFCEDKISEISDECKKYFVKLVRLSAGYLTM